MKNVLAVLVILLLPGLAIAQDLRCEIVDYGLYETHVDPNNYVFVDGGARKQYNVDVQTHLKTTDTVSRGDMPFKFGLRFVMHSDTVKDYDYVIRTYHPKGEGWASDPLKPLTSSGHNSTNKRIYNATHIAKDSHYVPGIWRKEVVVDGKVMCTKEYFFE